jgi:hypothetical protein
MTEPHTGIFIATKHMLLAVAGVLTALWGSWKLILSTKVEQLADHEGRIKAVETNTCSIEVLDEHMGEIKDGITEMKNSNARSSERIEKRIGEIHTRIDKAVEENTAIWKHMADNNNHS